MIRLLFVLVFVAGAHAQDGIFECAPPCTSIFNASTVNATYYAVNFSYSIGFGPENITGNFHNGVKELLFSFNNLASFDGTNLANSNIASL